MIFDYEKLLQGEENECFAFAQRIALSSFAVIRVPESYARTFQDVEPVLDAFFSRTAEEKERFKLLYQEYTSDALGFVGYNRPSLAKEVFRIREAGGEQKWPVEIPEFRSKSIAAFQLLSEIVGIGLYHLCALISLPFVSKSPIVQQTLQFPSYHSEPQTNWTFDSELFSKQNLLAELQPGEFSTSPFDMFRYENSEYVASVENCTKHTDPGKTVSMIFIGLSLSLSFCVYLCVSL